MRWSGRLQSRVALALVVLGVLAVGASGYLIRLTVYYFDQLAEDQTAVARDVLERAHPVYRQMVEAKREAFEARTRRMADQLRPLWSPADPSQVAHSPTPEELSVRLTGMLMPDVVQVWVERDGKRLGGAAGRTTGSEGKEAEREAVPVSVPIYPQDHDPAPGSGVDASTIGAGGEPKAGPGPGLVLRVSFVVPPELARDYLTLGELRQELDTVEVDGARVDRQDVVRAVVTALAAASAMVFFVALAAGVLVARTVTRRVSDVSTVMRKVAGGDLRARASDRGADEIARLAADLNSMLDELEQARQKVAYLQRIGAWQGIARRIAHEIKNPLTPILLAAQQLRDKALPLVGRSDPQFVRLVSDSVEIIEDEVAVMRRLVQSFSRFAKVPEVRTEPVDLSSIMTEFARSYGHFSDRPDDQLEVIEPSEPIPILGDRQLLKQALVNLVENAVLSAREAGVSPVQVRVMARVLDGRRGEITVDDNGPGIDIERREQVFEPYETTRDQGSGLGLAIVKKVVLDHGGEIAVTSSPLGGARMRLRIPLDQAPRPATPL